MPLPLWAVSEHNYAENYKKKVQPVLDAYEYGTFMGSGNMKIQYAHFTTASKSRECIVVLPGKSEPIQKYAELLESLNSGLSRSKYQYFLMDHRGQGGSQRLLTKTLEDRQKVHVDLFENFILDVKTFLDEVVIPSGCHNVYAIGHSMGAGIAIDFESQFPGYFKKLFLTSPMIKIQTKPYPYEVAKKIVETAVFVGKKNELALGQKGFDDSRDFKNNTFTTSSARYEMTMSLNDIYPETRLGGVTNNWLFQVMSNTDRIIRDYYRVKIPVIVMAAGIETYSYPDEMKKFCDGITECYYFLLKSSKHEILNDSDINRTQALSAIKLFFH